MSFAGLMPHRLEVYRVAAGSAGRDRFQQPVTKIGQMVALPTTYACRATLPSGGERFEERSNEVYVTRHRVYCELGADVHENDRIKVTDPRTGTNLIPDGNITVIKHVYGAQQLHHLELAVDVVRDPK